MTLLLDWKEVLMQGFFFGMGFALAQLVANGVMSLLGRK
jgi:hypothetical protein